MELNVVELSTDIQNKFKNKFNCGNSRLNGFFSGPEAMDPGVGKTYVFLSDDNAEMIGYYNITTGEIIEAQGQTKRIGGSIHINCFALDQRYHGLVEIKDEEGVDVKISDLLLRHCLNVIENLRTMVGFAFVTLSSTKEGYDLYRRASFEKAEADMFIPEKEMSFNCIPMYLPLDLE